MPGIFGEVIVILVLTGASALAVRFLWKSRTKGGCSGDCGNSGSCHK